MVPLVLLGENHPGYYEVGNTKSLREMLLRAETDKTFLSGLRKTCLTKARLFTYEREKNSWKKLLEKFK